MKILDAIWDGTLDTLKLIPFLFITYLVMEWVEHRTSDHTKTAIRKAGRLGPLVGGILGVIPQCGFSAAAASLYAGKVITAGTLIAVFLSTSDEMLPILLSERAGIGFIAKVLIVKALYGVIAGFLVDFLFRKLNERRIGIGIHGICTQEHCHCEKGIVRSALKHTVSITFFILLISIALNILLSIVGTENLSNLVLNRPVIGEVLAGLIGLIPNCAASIALTQLYLEGVMSAGAMVSGLMVGAGVGLLVLFRTNRHTRQNIQLTILLYILGVAGGLIVQGLRIF
ncbi:putative manganese transporter [Porcincola intestinalis]|uniref:putative manganese transporter n=1 Tax=Porcincola intestinalis TaxID=2606632 RepID=UPI002A7F8B18|nr:putative manganese transporter [Porcincola intestinalis]MDY4203932.1 putative manganese transporter [Porcincola intestinalis]